MSGSPSSGREWRAEPRTQGEGIGTGTGAGDPCVIEEVTTLNSISPPGLRVVRVGDVLDVVFVSGPPKRLIAQLGGGQLVGSITSRSMLQIIECIQNGRQYSADVLTIQGGACQVRVRLA